MRNAVRSGPAYAVMACAFVVLAALVVGILSGVGFGASGPPQASGRGASASSPERAGTTTDAPTGSPPGSSPRELDDRTTQAQRPGPAGTTRPPTASLPSESAGAQRSASANAAFARDFQAAFPDLAPHAGIAITATAGGGGVAAGGSVARGGDSVARGGDGVAAGGLQSGVAWSTIKVPLSMAALARDPSPQTRAYARSAITVSDNSAAESLWAGLGSGTPAAGSVGGILHQAGDRTTVVQAQRVRPPYTPFGQTVWTVQEQARLAAQLPCLSGGGDALPLMGAITPGQRWGLGRIPGAAFKGGWGPVGSGYLVRQFGTLTTPDGKTRGVAIMVQAPTFDAGTADLTRIASWLAPRLPHLPAGTCAGSR